MSSTDFGLLAEFGEPNIPLERVAPKYFGLSAIEARRRAASQSVASMPSFSRGQPEITMAR